jgi:hypothetical protein
MTRTTRPTQPEHCPQHHHREHHQQASMTANLLRSRSGKMMKYLFVLYFIDYTLKYKTLPYVFILEVEISLFNGQESTTFDFGADFVVLNDI